MNFPPLWKNNGISPKTAPTKPLVVALAGQPNVGKSAVFNELTGGMQYVGNWPGKTSEQESGFYHHNGSFVQIVDLPGANSLTASSLEERIMRDFLIREQPDVVAVIVNTVTLECNLYLLAELLALPVNKVVLGLNMIDLAEQQGIQIEAHVLEAALGFPVIPMVASKGIGVEELVEAAVRVIQEPEACNPNRPDIRIDHRTVLEELSKHISGKVPEPYACSWVAIKLLEGDTEITDLMQNQLRDDWEVVHNILLQHEDAILSVASGRYEWIARMIRAAVVQPRTGQVTLTDHIDRIATHPLWGLFILVGILGLLFALTYSIGTPIQNWMDTFLVQGGSQWVLRRMAEAPEWLTGLVVHGALTGVGTVLTLLPILVIFFASLGLLEDVGYMARAAFVMDRFMHRMGLHGKSFMPLFLGFGCNVPAVMGARIIEAPKARLVTILITPLVPCTARMAVMAMLAPIFFGNNALWVSWGLIGLSLLVLTGVGTLLHECFLGGEHKAFVMELPLYHLPNLRTIGVSIWQRIVDFLKMAGSIILVVSIVLWALTTYPGESFESSFLANLGQKMSPIGSWMGLDWQMLVALLTSFVRKENTIPTLAVLYGVGTEGASLTEVLSGVISPAAALAFLAVQILFIPCIATMAVIKQETNSWRWTIFSVLLLLVISFTTGILIYQGAKWIGWGI